MKLCGVYKHRTNIPHNNNCPVGTKNVEYKKSIIKLSYISYTTQEEKVINLKFNSKIHVKT